MKRLTSAAERWPDSDERYRLLAETTRDIIVLHDRDGRITYVNGAGLEFSGFSAEEALGRTITDFVPPDRLDEVIAHQARRDAGDMSTFRYDIEFVNRAGQRVPVEIASTPILHDDRAGEILVVARDISDRVRVEQMLRQTTDNLAMLIGVSSAWKSYHETGALLQKIVDDAGHLAGMGSAAIYFLRDDILRLEAACPALPPGMSEELREAPLSDHPHIQRALSTTSPVTVPDTRSVDLTIAELAAVELRDLRSLLYVPLGYQGNVIGVLIVGSVGEPHQFSDDEVSVYQALATHASLQIEETRLHEGNRQVIADLKQEIATRVQAEEALHAALDQADVARVALLSVMEDQRQIETALREIQAQFRTLFDANPLAIGLYGGDGRFLRCNPAMLDLLGYSSEELASLDPTHPDDRDDGKGLFEKLITGEIEHYEREKRYLHRDGQVIWVQITATGVRDADNDLLYVMLVNQDITTRKEAEQKLLESETMLRLIFDNASDGINVYEEIPEPRSRRLVNCNERYAEMAGRSRAELLAAGSTRGMQINLGTQRSPEENRKLREERKPYRGTIAWLRPDSRDNVIEYTAVPVELGGRLLTIGIDRDITDRIRAEEKLEEYADRLEDLVAERTRALETAQESLLRQARLATLGQIAGSIAHELRTPLGAIKNAAYLVGMLAQGTDETLRETLDILNQAVHTSDHIITTLLNFARPRQPHRQLVEVGEVVESAMQRLRLTPDVRPEMEIEAGLPLVIADATHLEQALGNLLLNAIQAMPEGGRLTIRVSKLAALPDFAPPGFAPEGRDHAAAEWISVVIADTGVGITPESLPLIFEPLFTTKPTGIGLGLALVKMLIEAAGGGVAVKSIPGQGTEFEVYLPIAGPQSSDRSAADLDPG